jgi:hypothetical protein
MIRPLSHIFVILGMLIAFLSVGCATGRAPDSGASRASADSVQAKIKPLVEDLYLKTRDLEAICLDLRTVANTFAFLPDDRQLSHIQKTALYVQNALQGATHQKPIPIINCRPFLPAKCHPSNFAKIGRA